MKNKKYFIVDMFFLFFLLVFFNRAAISNESAFQFSLERIIYNEGEKSISIGLRNNESDPYLVQVGMKWLDESTGLNIIEKEDKPPFFITPLLYKLEPENYFQWKIQFSGKRTALPQDRETVYIAQFRLIPATDGNKNNIQVTFIRSLNFKVYYRPKNISKLKIKDMESKLSFSVRNNKLIAKNTSPIYLSFDNIKIDGKDIDMQELSKNVPPFSEQVYAIQTSNVKEVSWQIFDEFLFPLEVRTQDIK